MTSTADAEKMDAFLDGIQAHLLPRLYATDWNTTDAENMEKAIDGLRAIATGFDTLEKADGLQFPALVKSASSLLERLEKIAAEPSVDPDGKFRGTPLHLIGRAIPRPGESWH